MEFMCCKYREFEHFCRRFRFYMWNKYYCFIFIFDYYHIYFYWECNWNISFELYFNNWNKVSTSCCHLYRWPSASCYHNHHHRASELQHRCLHQHYCWYVDRLCN